MTQIMKSPSSAEFFLGWSGTFEGSRELARTFIRGLRLSPGNLFAGPLPTRRSDASAMTFFFDTPGGRMAAAIVYVRSGRALGSLTPSARATS